MSDQESVLAPDRVHEFIKQCVENITDKKTLVLTLRYFVFAREISTYPDWGTPAADHMSCKLRLAFDANKPVAVFAIRTDGVLQIWHGEVEDFAPTHIKEWFRTELDKWCDMEGRGKESRVIELSKQFKTDKHFKQFQNLFIELKSKTER